MQGAAAAVLNLIMLSTLQDAKSRPAVLRKQPFVVTRSFQGAQATVSIKLLLSDVIDEAYRIHTFQHEVPVGSAAAESTPGQDGPFQHVYTFTTQVATYTSSTASLPAACADAVSPAPSSEPEPAAKKARLVAQ